MPKAIFFKLLNYRPIIKGFSIYPVEISPADLLFKDRSIKGYVTSNKSIELAYYGDTYSLLLKDVHINKGYPEKKIDLKEDELVIDFLSKNSLTFLPLHVVDRMKKVAHDNDKILFGVLELVI